MAWQSLSGMGSGGNGGNGPQDPQQQANQQPQGTEYTLQGGLGIGSFKSMLGYTNDF